MLNVKRKKSFTNLSRNIDKNTNELILKLKHHGLYPSGTNVLAGDSIINDAIKEKISERNRPVKVNNFPVATVVHMEHYLIPIIHKKTSNFILATLFNNQSCSKLLSNFDIFLIQPNFEKPKDVQIPGITDSLSLNIFSDLSLPHQVEEVTHL